MTDKDTLMNLIDEYAEVRHINGCWVYNTKTAAARQAVIEALSGVQALSAAPAGFVPVAAFDRLHAHAESLAARLLAASPTPPAEQQAITPETGNSASAQGAAITSEFGTPPAEQQAAPKAAPKSFLDGADVQDESGVLAYYSREAVLACINAALESVAATKAAPGEPPGIQALMCVISSLRDWAYAQTAAFQPSPTAQADSVPAVEREQERIAFKDAHRHLDLDEVSDAWGRPMFKHSHVEASWLGWIARASSGQAPAGARYEKGLEDVLRERDEADDYIDTLLDEVLGADRAEWSSAYGRADALEEVRERITALHKPAVERAWKQFEAATKQPGDVVAYLDVGAGGYLDLDAALSDEAMQQLPKGRHALVIAGTYGIDGYVAAPQPSPTTKPAPQQEAQESCGWDGAEEWEKLAWHLCAEENGEDACNELIWEGGPMPEPWGDRWLKYEGEARRMIALVRTHVPAPQPASVSSDTLYLLRRLLSNQHTLTGSEFRAELEKIVGEAYQQEAQEPVALLVRKNSWRAGQWEAAPPDSPTYGMAWADHRQYVYTAPQPAPAPLSDDAKDAARYRWLRATTNFATNSQGERIDVRNQPEKWDAAIDAAVRKFANGDTP